MVLNGKMERDIPHLQVKIKDDNFLSTSHRHLSSLAGSNTISNTLNQMSQVLFYDQQSINRVAQSAHTYFLDSYTSSLGNARPKALTNPFAPASIQIPMAPGRRRWAHTFPMGPDNIPWHFHHVRNREKQSKMNDKIQLTAFIEFLLPGTIKKVPNSLFNKAKILNGRNQNGGVVRNKRLARFLKILRHIEEYDVFVCTFVSHRILFEQNSKSTEHSNETRLIGKKR